MKLQVIFVVTLCLAWSSYAEKMSWNDLSRFQMYKDYVKVKRELRDQTEKIICSYPLMMEEVRAAKKIVEDCDSQNPKCGMEVFIQVVKCKMEEMKRQASISV